MLDVKILKDVFISVLDHTKITIVNRKVHWERFFFRFKNFHCFLKICWWSSFSFLKYHSWVCLINLLTLSYNSNLILNRLCFRIYIKITHIQSSIGLECTKDIKKSHLINTGSCILDQNLFHMDNILRVSVKL